jgi:hypothetical protein
MRARALEAAADCRHARGGTPQPAPVEVVLGTRHELGLSWIVPMLKPLADAQAGLTLHLYFGSGADPVARVRGVAIDCAVTCTRLTDPKLDSIRLHREDYVFVGAPRLLERRPLRRAEDAHDYFRLVFRVDDPRRALLRGTGRGHERGPAPLGLLG